MTGSGVSVGGGGSRGVFLTYDVSPELHAFSPAFVLFSVCSSSKPSPAE